MAFPTDWDVDKYQVEHECEEHWELRRQFLIEHKEKYPEDRLVCLAQVFYNVEFYGCRYPEKTMRLVAQLSQGVADDHREKMKTKLQRTFVQASDAASTKVKGRSGNEGTAPKVFKPINFHKETGDSPQSMDIPNGETSENPEGTLQEPTIETTPNAEQNIKTDKKKKRKKPKKKKKSGLNPPAADSVPGRFVLADQSIFEDSKPNNKRSIESLPNSSKKFKPNKNKVFSNLVLMEGAADGMNPYGILSRSTGASHMTLKQEAKKTNAGTEVTLLINNEVLSVATADTQEKARHQCAEEGLTRLRKECYTLVVKDRFAGSVVDKSEVSGDKTKVEAETPEHLAEDSKANRMMKLMGWGGGGLGKDQQGRKEPVQVTQQVKRAGLGSGLGDKQSTAQFRKIMTDMLSKFQRGEGKHDLVFASDFSKEERAAIHLLAKRFSLKSSSYGKDENRQLVVSKKKTPYQIVREVQDAGGSTDKYDLVLPGGF